MKKSKFLTVFALLSIFFVNFFYLQKPTNCKADNYAKAECVMEKNSRRVLYERNGELRLPMASTTKIATAITVLEAMGRLDEEFKIPKEAVGIEGSSIDLKENDAYSAEELLYGLMLRSGNDAATSLALKTAKSVEDFALLMNETAKKAGALSTNFKNPHGLPSNGHYTTARDLSLITCYALHNAKFKKIVSTKYYEKRNWQNKNKLLRLYPYAIGVKTGYTKEAGKCLVSAAEKNGLTLVCTLLSSADTYNRTIQLFESCFNKYKMERILSKSDKFLIDCAGKAIRCSAKTNFDYPLCEGEREHVEIVTTSFRRTEENKEALEKEIYGKIEIYLLKRLIFSENLYKL